MKNATLDWFITNKCNSGKCPFCYAPWNQFPKDATLTEAVNICDEIQKKGFTQITLCGGEPLLYPHINTIIKKLKDNNIKIVFYAGSEIEKIIEVVDYINILSLPIEAISMEIQSELRGIKLHVDVFKLLKNLQDSSSRPRIKIGTVVNAVNINEIEKIFFELMKYNNVIDTWRLYMFSPAGKGKLNESQLLITEKEFQNCIDNINSLIKKHQVNIDISSRSREANKGYCLIMDSKGYFYRYEEDYIPLDITIYDCYEDIIKGYDMNRHALQKEWHTDEKDFLMLENRN